MGREEESRYSSNKRKKDYTVDDNDHKRHRKFSSQPSSSLKTEHSCDFTFQNYKQSLNRILSYGSANNPISNNLNDLWKFITKYETTLKKAGKPIFDKETHLKVENNSIGIPVNYSKHYCINYKYKFKYFETFSEDGQQKLTEEIFVAFLDIIAIYLDFKNKEKYDKLRKLRQAQNDLPVAKYR